MIEASTTSPFDDLARRRPALARPGASVLRAIDFRRPANRLPAMLLTLLCVFAAALHPAQAAPQQIAEQTWKLGDHVAHANAVRTDFLAPEVADKFEIERSTDKALVTISVQKSDGSTPAELDEAEVRVTATWPSESAEQVAMRRHRTDDGHLYYLGVLPIRDHEPVRFELAIAPEPQGETYRFGFERYFFTD